MPDLSEKWFSGNGTIPANLISQIEIASLGLPVNRVLQNLGWDGSKAVACLGFELSPDNKHVARAQFLLRGPLSEDQVSVSAVKIWPGAAKEVTLHINVPEGGNFHFNAGTLASDFIACEDVKFRFEKNGRPLLPAEWPAHNVGEFAIRAVCHLAKNSNRGDGPALKYNILLFPASVGELKQLEPGSKSAAWPGAKLAEGTCPFFPGAGQTGWQDPICPLICRGSHASEAPNLPEGDEILYFVSAVMRTAKVAVTCSTAAILKAKWAKASSDVTTLEKEPVVTWPNAKRHAPPQGRSTLPIWALFLPCTLC
jgi:hypothetical protein